MDAGSLDGLLEVSLGATTTGLCAGTLTPGGLVGRGGTVVLFANICNISLSTTIDEPYTHVRSN